MTGWSIFGDYVKANKLRSNLPFVWYFKAGLQGDDDDNNNNNNNNNSNYIIIIIIIIIIIV